MTDNPKDAYQLGWDDGYVEGYGSKLVDITEPFMPAGTPADIEAASIWLHRKYSAIFTKSEAIGVARGMIAVLQGKKS